MQIYVIWTSVAELNGNIRVIRPALCGVDPKSFDSGSGHYLWMSVFLTCCCILVSLGFCGLCASLSRANWDYVFKNYLTAWHVREDLDSNQSRTRNAEGKCAWVDVVHGSAWGWSLLGLCNTGAMLRLN